MIDSSTRTQALNPAQSFIVQAPAGSGKTELLTRRILTLLATQCRHPEELLAITFTKKAAHEMRTRVIETLQLGLENAPEKDSYHYTSWQLSQRVLAKNKEQQWNLLENPQRLRIMTIDKFCRMLAQQSPLQTYIHPSVSMTENDAFYEQVCAQFLQDCLAQQHNVDAVSTLLYQLDNQRDKAIGLLIDLLKNRNHWITPLLAIKADQQTAIKVLEHNLHQCCLQLTEAAQQKIPAPLIVKLRQCLTFSLQQRNVDIDINDSIIFWSQLGNLLLTSKGELLKQVSKRHGFPPESTATNSEEKATYKQQKSMVTSCLLELKEIKNITLIIIQLKTLPSPKYNNDQVKLIDALVTLLPQLYAHLQQAFNEQQCADYSHISDQAKRALQNEDGTQNPSRLLMKLDYQIHHLLIDEFQDTSLAQYQLFEQLTAEWLANEGKTIFLVGDPMQSIYQFRQAEVSLFAHLVIQQRWGNLQLTALQLQSNFRSSSELIDHFNSLYQNIFPEKENLNLGEITYTPASSPKPTKTNNTSMQLWHCFETEQQQATAIIEHIKQLQANDPKQSIAILVRGRSHLNFILPALQQANISYQSNEVESLYQQAVISDLLHLTRALFDLNDRIAWLAILRAPWCGLLLSDLLLLQSIDDSLVWQQLKQACALLSADGKIRAQHLIDCLSHALHHYQRIPLSELLKLTWLNLGAQNIYTADEQGYSHHFFQLINKLESATEAFTIAQLAEQLQKIKISTLSSTSTNSVEKTKPCPVNIMTIHRSKGLEFDHVLLIQLNKKPPSSGKPLLVLNQDSNNQLLFAPLNLHDHNNEIYHFIHQATQAKEQAEICRQLYVAATRAKQSLHYFATITADTKPQKNSLLSLAWHHLSDLEKNITLNHHSDETVKKDDKHQKRTQLLRRLTSNWYVNKTSSSKGNAPSEQTFTRQLAPLSLPKITNDQYGNMIHAYLAYLGLDAVAQQSDAETLLKQAIRFWQRSSHRYGMPQTQLPQHLDELIIRLQPALNDKVFRWIIQPHQNAENELKLATVEGSENKEYTIDRTFIDEENVRWIIDYKTHVFSANDELEKIKQRMKTEHQDQLNNYRQLMTDIDTKHPIKTALYLTSMALLVPIDQ